MGKRSLPPALYDVEEVEWIQSPGLSRVDWKVCGWQFTWEPSMLSVYSRGIFIPLAVLASPELAVAFSLGWHARGKLRELPSESDV